MLGGQARLDGGLDDRLGELDCVEQDGVALVAEGVAGGHVLQADGGGDVAGMDGLDLFALVGVHHQQLGHAQLLAVAAVQHGGADLDQPRVDPEIDQLPHVRVAHDLEDQGRHGLAVRKLAGQRPAAPGVRAFHVPLVRGGRQVVDHGVQQVLHGLVLEGGTEQHRDRLQAQGGGAHRLLHEAFGNVLLFQEQFHDLVVQLGQVLDQLLAVQQGLLAQVGGDFLGLDAGAGELAVVAVGLHGDEVDHPGEIFLAAQGQLQRQRQHVEFVLDLADHVEKVGADAVHLVDVSDPGDVVLGRLAPDLLGLGLDAADAAQDDDGPVEHAQRALDLGGEVDVAGGINDVDAVVVPEAGGGGGGDGDAALLLLLHPVHDGGAVVDLAHLVGHAGIVQDPFGGGGLAGVDMRHDADIADLVHRNGFHFMPSFDRALAYQR